MGLTPAFGIPRSMCPREQLESPLPAVKRAIELIPGKLTRPVFLDQEATIDQFGYQDALVAVTEPGLALDVSEAR